jgi:hypothetical protein
MPTAKTSQPPERISRKECAEKAAESRGLAEHVSNSSQRVMLEHIADTWDRIAASLPAAR